jgi:N,N'-diacetyllegionaminate synthase
MSIEIIAEIAQGFEGKPHQAAALVRVAADAGADAAKLQLVYASELAVAGYKYYDLFGTLEMPDSAWADLAALSKQRSIKLHLDIFGPRSLGLAEKLGAGAVKIHATDLSNEGLLKMVAASGVERVLLSCGGGFRSEIEHALSVLSAKKIVLLLGFQGYPTPNIANQIARVRAFEKQYGRADGSIIIGFADHAPPETGLSHVLSAAALGAGATVLEKHLTLAKVMKLEDHESAMNPDEFSAFVSDMRAGHEALGTCESGQDDFGMHESEMAYRRMVRKHVVATRALPAGTVLAPADLALKRSATENALDDIASAYGKRLLKAIAQDEAVTADLLQGTGDR